MESSSPYSLCRVLALSQGNTYLTMNTFCFGVFVGGFGFGFLGVLGGMILCSNTFETSSDKNLCLNTDYISNYITFLTCLKLL